MPIVQVRSTLEQQWLSAPFPPMPDQLRVLTEWRKPDYRSELVVYPPDYMGNISPPAWRVASNFLLSVDNTGERAELMALGRLPQQKTDAEVIAELKTAAPAGVEVGSVTEINRTHRSAYVSSALRKGTLALGGLVLHTGPDELTLLRQWFRETEVQT